jgi:hypothetical protein
MIHRLCGAAALVGVLASPSVAQAWSYEVHQLIMDRAIALLPIELRPIFEKNRAMVVQHAIDPDTWRTAGFESELPNHQLDIDWEGFGKYPFAELPRDYSAAVAKFGKNRIDQEGRLPWRTEEFFGNLRRAFEAYPRNGPFGSVAIILFAAALSHYVSDAHQPFHAVSNYDGQLTNQRGLHARFEVTLYERFRDRFTFAPRARAPILNPRDFAFDVIIEGSQLVPAILASDLKAIGNKDAYDAAYYATFFQDNQAVLERRVNESIAAVAAIITGAWQAAGSPPVPLNPPQPEERIRRP